MISLIVGSNPEPQILNDAHTQSLGTWIVGPSWGMGVWRPLVLGFFAKRVSDTDLGKKLEEAFDRNSSLVRL